MPNKQKIMSKIKYCAKMLVIVVWGLLVTVFVALTMAGCASTHEPVLTPNKPVLSDDVVRPKSRRLADHFPDYNYNSYKYCPYHQGHPTHIMKQ